MTHSRLQTQKRETQAGANSDMDNVQVTHTHKDGGWEYTVRLTHTTLTSYVRHIKFPSDSKTSTPGLNTLPLSSLDLSDEHSQKNATILLLNTQMHVPIVLQHSSLLLLSAPLLVCVPRNREAKIAARENKLASAALSHLSSHSPTTDAHPNGCA